jgi:hypothetical protein
VSAAAAVALAQHALGLASTLAIGWITAHLTRFRTVIVPLVTVAAAVLPRPLHLEHAMMADSLVACVFVATVALVFPLERFTGRRFLWFLAGCAVLVALKPHARPLWLGLMCATVLVRGFPWRWGLPALGTIALALLLIATSGSSRQGNWLLLSSTFPLIQIHTPAHAEYKKLLAPHVLTARSNLSDFAWNQSDYKKPLAERNPASPRALFGPEWCDLVKDRARYSKVTRDLSREAIRAEPVLFASLTIRKILASLGSTEKPGGFIPSMYWADQAEANAERWADTPYEMTWLYDLTADQWPAFVAERSARPVPWPDPVLRFITSFTFLESNSPEGPHPGTLRVKPLGALVFAGILAAAAIAAIRRPACFLILPVVIYLVLVYSIGDMVDRYLVAVDWPLVILAGIGADALLRLAALPFTRKPSHP